MKPVLFVGSSSEKSDIAVAIQNKLDSTADVKVWNQGIFGLTRSTLDSLVEAADKSDFGVFVLAPDDIVKLRKNRFQAPRDNLVFELGLFLGRLGSERTYFMVPASLNDLRLPSDLAGITAATYDGANSDLGEALHPACLQIRQQVETLGIRQARLPQPSVERLPDAAILCASTVQFEQLGFDEDASVLETAFPKRVEVARSLTSERLEQLLTSRRFSIVHLLCAVDPNTGDVLFSSVRDDGSVVEPRESMSSEGFSKLVEFSGARLVVLASCDSLILAAKLARVTNFIAATNWINTKTIVRWERSFYDCLVNGQPLSASYELATSVSGAPMLLLMKKDFVLSEGV